MNTYQPRSHLNLGDLIPTGTPAGSAVMKRNWLVAGDEIKIEIEKLGFIKNKVIEEPEDTPVLDHVIETEYDVIVAGYGPVGETCANLAWLLWYKSSNFR